MVPSAVWSVDLSEAWIRCIREASPGKHDPLWEKARAAYRNEVLPNTLDPDSPVVELGWPTSGHYAMSSRGVEMDLISGGIAKA